MREAVLVSAIIIGGLIAFSFTVLTGYDVDCNGDGDIDTRITYLSHSVQPEPQDAYDDCTEQTFLPPFEDDDPVFSDDELDIHIYDESGDLVTRQDVSGSELATSAEHRKYRIDCNGDRDYDEAVYTRTQPTIEDAEEQCGGWGSEPAIDVHTYNEEDELVAEEAGDAE